MAQPHIVSVGLLRGSSYERLVAGMDMILRTVALRRDIAAGRAPGKFGY